MSPLPLLFLSITDFILCLLSLHKLHFSLSTNSISDTMLSELKLFVAALKSEKENSEKDGIPPPPATPPSPPPLSAVVTPPWWFSVTCVG
ncbi:hypothetical protein BRARA_G00886 [Brassica rapa]|uniref:Uncharacterized protein n=1 Tax=Brassica campestris TaxID=3711 RepID=A0A397YJ80_BRACM|nr:hypothetical protein BRARA_G00886 [Brassica rapa]